MADFIARGHRTVEEYEKHLAYLKELEIGQGLHKECLDLIAKYPKAVLCGGTFMTGEPYWASTRLLNYYDDFLLDMMKQSIARTKMHCDENGQWVDCENTRDGVMISAVEYKRLTSK